jgi:Flp pilus assembly pilin Flp
MRVIRDGIAALLTEFRRDSAGITALEYGIIASALAFVLIAAFSSLGTPLSTIMSKVGSGL